MGSRKLEDTLRFKVRGLAALLLLVLACGDIRISERNRDSYRF